MTAPSIVQASEVVPSTQNVARSPWTFHRLLDFDHEDLHGARRREPPALRVAGDEAEAPGPHAARLSFSSSSSIASQVGSIRTSTA